MCSAAAAKNGERFQAQRTTGQAVSRCLIFDTASERPQQIVTARPDDVPRARALLLREVHT